MLRAIRLLGALLSLVLFLLSCSTTPKGTFFQEGYASWYGKKFHGRSTASGETYNMFEFTAAHKTLPFGTRVLVHSKRSGKTVEVRINDRGPFISGRVIDLSYAAAKELGIITIGQEGVELRVR